MQKDMHKHREIKDVECKFHTDDNDEDWDDEDEGEDIA